MTPIKIPAKVGASPPPNPTLTNPTTQVVEGLTPSTEIETPKFCFKGCLYGGSNTGKSTMLAAYARYIWKTFKRRTRVFSFDAGGTIAYDPLIQAGVVDYYHINEFYGGKISPEALFRGISKGVWFKREGSKIQVVRETTLPADVGALFVEGTDSTCSAIGRDFIERGLKLGQDTVGQYEIENLVSDEKVLGGKMAPSHYGVIQDNMLQQYVPSFWQLPYPDAVVLTTHDGAGKDEEENSSGKSYGPALIGSAGTRKVPQQTVVLLHADTVMVKMPTGETGSEFRVYYDKHQDPNNPMKIGALYPANCRLDLHAYQKLKKVYPKQYFVSDPASPTGSLTEFIGYWKQFLKESLEGLS
jgi:hypothetical protein